MDNQPLLKHARAFFFALLSVMATQAALAGLNYIGAHIPDVITFITQLSAAHAAAYATLK